MCGDLGYFTYCGYDSLPGADEGSRRGSGSGDSEEYDVEPPDAPTVTKPGTGAGGKVTVSVTAERGSRIEVRDANDAVVAKAAATGSAQRISFTAEDGDHTYSVVAVDPAGNSSVPSAEFTLTTDATKPTAHTLAAAPADRATAAVSVSFTAEHGTVYDIRVAGRKDRLTGTVAAGGTVREELWLPNGRHSITATVRDSAGNATVLTQQAVVDLHDFRPVVTHDAAYRTRTPVLRVTGPRGGKGTLTVGGARHDIVLDTYGRADVPVSLIDGNHLAQVALADPFGRRGAARSKAFTVDTAPPPLALTYDADRARYGDAVVRITGEKGARVLVESPGAPPRRAILTGVPEDVLLQMRPGRHVVTVTATDRVGNTTRQTIGLDVSDEWTAGEIQRLVLWCLGVLALVAVTGVLLWRRRRAIVVRYARWREAARVAAEERAVRARAEGTRRAREAYERDLSGWRRERDRLRQLRDLAVNQSAEEYAHGDFRWGRRKAGEKVLLVCTASLVEVRTRQGVHFTDRTESGEIAVTNLRVLFQGITKRREWEYGKWLRHDHDAAASQTLITVANRQRTSGVAYPPVEAERVRLVIDVALARARGEHPDEVERIRGRLAEHERRRPVEPAEAQGGRP
ncbi:hypothetical protein ACFY7C_23625 [Streptomyces sp. NPDC012769]|uniref:hypothetical protein n=1 Tax=Streptomyces sp. NPDC012769 TaxID=3364848 RepID=UPI00367AF0C7